MDILSLSLIAFCTSLLTAVVGLGGGMLLIASMPGFLPGAVIIPIHSLVQLASNSSRGLFAYRHICWQFGLPFLLGSIIGGGLAAQFTARINLDYLPLFIAGFILYTLWGPKLKFNPFRKGEILFIGFLQTGLGMLVGATGPLGQSNLVRRGLAKDALVATTALFMTITHIIKITLFGLLGFVFVDYWQLVLSMVCASILGSFVGTHVRQWIPELNFALLIKILLTLLAMRMVYITLG